MNNYIEALCIGKPMDLPSYNEDTEQWEVYFEENYEDYHPYFGRDIISYSCEDAEEATEIYNYYNQNPIMEETEHEEVNS